MLLLRLLLVSRQWQTMELRLSLLLCGQWKTVEWGLSRLMMVVILRPVVGDIANMNWLRTHGCHLLSRLSPRVDPGPDRHLFVLQCLRILVTSALDALVAILENHAVFLEKLEPAVFKLFVVFHLVDQFFEDCFVNLAYVVLLETISMISDTAQKVQGQKVMGNLLHPCRSSALTFKFPIVVKGLPQRGKLQTDLFFFSWTFSM